MHLSTALLDIRDIMYACLVHIILLYIVILV